VVEYPLGEGEVVSSILTGSTSFYLGHLCAHCDEMVLWLTDASRGVGPIHFEAVTPEDEIVRERCIRGHWNEFRLEELRRFQWWPRLNS
jgi:hypothetical protein